MKYPVAIHHDNASAYGVIVPDVPGCFSAGDTFNEALENTIEALQGHLTLLAEEGITAPVARQIDDYFNHPDYAGAVWGFVDIDTSAYSGKTEKVNVTLPQITRTRIDKLVDMGKVKSRSAFLNEAALEKLGRMEKNNAA